METTLGSLIDATFTSETGTGVVALRLLVATVLGALIGIDREWRDKPAGLKTHMLVTLGAAVFAILALELFQEALRADDDARPDPVRIVEAMVKGAAFLGAGAIIQSRGSIEGLTTGASVWMAGAIGLAAGTGQLGIAILATALGIGVLVMVGLVERKAIEPLRHRHGGNGDSEGGQRKDAPPD